MILRITLRHHETGGEHCAEIDLVLLSAVGTALVIVLRVLGG